MSNLTTYAVLEHNFLFQGLPHETIEAIAHLARRETFKKGTLIFSQGDAADALFGVASGQVRIFAADANGHEMFLNVLGPGETFGEIALLDGLSRTASATATEQTTLVVIPRKDFLRHLENDPGLAIHLMKLLCSRLRWVSDLVEESAFLAGPARVAQRLTHLVEINGRPLPDGSIEIVMSQADLGRFIGVSRQIINQYLRKWCEQDWVRLKRGRITIRNLPALRNLVETQVSDA